MYNTNCVNNITYTVTVILKTTTHIFVLQSTFTAAVKSRVSVDISRSCITYLSRIGCSSYSHHISTYSILVSYEIF